jgi:hypothetical protein
MSLLFWSLPFMIMSGCFDALYGSDGMPTPGAGRAENNRRTSGCRQREPAYVSTII